MATTGMWLLSDELTRTIINYARGVATQNGATVELAEDVAQITVLRINEAARRNSAVRTLVSNKGWRGYVATATRNVLAGHHRSEARRLRRESASIEDSARLASEIRELEQLEAAILLEQLSSSLSAEEQIFVHLRWFQGLTIREVAAHLNVSESVAWHLGRGVITKLELRLRAHHDE